MRPLVWCVAPASRSVRYGPSIRRNSRGGEIVISEKQVQAGLSNHHNLNARKSESSNNQKWKWGSYLNGVSRATVEKRNHCLVGCPPWFPEVSDRVTIPTSPKMSRKSCRYWEIEDNSCEDHRRKNDQIGRI